MIQVSQKWYKFATEIKQYSIMYIRPKDKEVIKAWEALGCPKLTNTVVDIDEIYRPIRNATGAGYGQIKTVLTNYLKIKTN